MLPLDQDLPAPLVDLFDESLTKLSIEDLRIKCREYRKLAKVTLQQVQKIEKATRNQSECELWNLFRAGRQNASKTYAICHTSLENPSITIIKEVCYPFEPKVQTFWMRRGKDLESTTMKYYIAEMKRRGHINLKVYLSGYVISLETPWIGGSPDAVIICDCCGKGLVEGKALKTVNSDVDVVPPKFSYRIQTQLYCVGPMYSYCDYVVYHPDHVNKVTIKRVVHDVVLQEEIVEKCSDFFTDVVLPELFAMKSISDANSNLICYCGKSKADPIIRCKGENCMFVEFHVSCMNLTRTRKNWYRPQCDPKK